MNAAVAKESAVRMSKKAIACFSALALAMGLASQPVMATTLQQHSFAYDSLGRMTSDTDANGKVTTYTYDGNGNRLTVTDPLGRVTTYTYDALNRLSTVTDANNGVTRYAYDALDHLVTVTDPLGNATTFAYNGLDQVTSRVSPDTGTTSYVYANSGSNPTQRTDAAGTVATYTYDALDRLGSVSYSDGTGATYTYDGGSNALGHLTRVSDSRAGITNFTYDNYGRILNRIVYSNGFPAQARTLAHSYNSLGQLSQLTYPSGDVVSYTYDSLGRVQSLSLNGNTVLSNVTYRPFGGVTGWTWANGTTHTVGYDQNGNINSETVGSTTLQLAYDNAQRLTSSTDISNSAIQSYVYDVLDHLSSYTGLSTSYSWTYDANGNRKTQTQGTATDTYVLASGSNRLQSISLATGGSKTYTTLSTGQVRIDGDNTYNYYSGNHRMYSATNAQTTDIVVINPLGERLFKATASSTKATGTFYYYDEAGHLIAETDPSGGAPVTGTSGISGTPGNWTDYLYLGDIPVAVYTSRTGSNGPGWWTNMPQAPSLATNADGITASLSSSTLLQYQGSNRLTFHTYVSGASPATYTGQHTYTASQNVVSTFTYNTGATTASPGRLATFTVQGSGSGNSTLGVKVTGSTASLVCINAGSPCSNNGSVLTSSLIDNTIYFFSVSTGPGGNSVVINQRAAAATQTASAGSLNWDPTNTGATRQLMVASSNNSAQGSGSTTDNPSYLLNLGEKVSAPVALYNIHTDQLGTPRQITTSDINNTLVWRWDSEPFGTTAPNQDPLATGTAFVFNLRFPGQYADVELGTNYNFMRDYKPAAGRYVESDPIGLNGGMNTYGYVKGNPVNDVDQRGLANSSAVGAMGPGNVGISPASTTPPPGILSAETQTIVNAALHRSHDDTEAAYNILSWARGRDPYNTSLACAEHYMFARDWTHRTHGLAALSLIPAVGGYEAIAESFNLIGVQGPHRVWDGSNPTWNALLGGYQGILDGLLY